MIHLVRQWTTARTAVVFFACSLVAVSGGSGVAHAQAFFNRAPIMPADASTDAPGVAALYPSTIDVPPGLGEGGTLEHLSVALYGVAHDRSSDLDVLLVPPAASGRAPIVLMSDTTVNSLNGDFLLFTDSATKLLQGFPDGPAYRATNVGAGDVFPGAGAAVSNSDLTTLRGMDPTGEWKLYVVDDETGTVGGITGGWSLLLFVEPGKTQNTAITVNSPTTIGTVHLALPFPSTLVMSNITTPVDHVLVDLLGVTHERPDDLEVIVKSPSGACVRLMSDAGGASAVSNLNLRFASFGVPMPDAGPLQADETYTPANHAQGGIDLDLSTTTAGCSSVTTNLDSLASAGAAGTWSLFVGDDAIGANGSIAGWRVMLDTTPLVPDVTVVSPVPSNATLTGALNALTLTGTVTPGATPVSSIRWIVFGRTDDGGVTPHSYEQGPWQPLASGGTAWTLSNVPVPFGHGQIIIEARDAAGLISSAHINFANEMPTYSLAEGATGPFFDLDVAIFNPGTVPVQADIAFLTPTGPPITETRTLAAHQRIRIPVDSISGLDANTVSTVVTSHDERPLIVERTMFWDQTRYGGHGGNAASPSTTWYFAEGAQGFFKTFLLLTNPSTTAAHINVRFLVEGEAPVDHPLTLAAQSRDTIDAGSIPALLTRSFGIVVESDQPVMAERTMYFGNTGRLWEGGHESTGVTQPATDWLLAEGATGSFFETYVLAANPGAQAGTVTMSFLTAGGNVVTKSYAMPAWGRVSINIEKEHPLLASTAVSTRVTSTIPIVVERAMYWPGSPAEWTEAHNSTGLAQLGTVWAIADGRLGGAQHFSTYILLVNPGDQAAAVDVLLVRDSGEEITQQVVVPAHSRFTVDGGAAAPAWAQDGEFAAILTSTNAVPIAVERATYWNADGRFWSGGVNVLGTRLR